MSVFNLNSSQKFYNLQLFLFRAHFQSYTTFKVKNPLRLSKLKANFIPHYFGFDCTYFLFLLIPIFVVDNNNIYFSKGFAE